jgi:hypothetical protein
MSAHDTEDGSLLFWAIAKSSIVGPGIGSFGVTNHPHKTPSRFLLYSYGSNGSPSPAWTTAHKEDWDFYDECVGGQLYKACDLVQCPKGTFLSHDQGE